nr:XRE family transcriptional regulator [Streptomyces sp. 2P-4]
MAFRTSTSRPTAETAAPPATARGGRSCAHGIPPSPPLRDHRRHPRRTARSDLPGWHHRDDHDTCQAGTQQMLAEVRAYRLAEVRKRQHITQNQVAEILGATQGRVSAIERGEVRRSEAETLASCVAALGGQLKLVAVFGDESPA